ncbi:MAG: thiamine pyrophosphate-binding protein [Gammaproteobacteria bacterium]|jgi:indolepyruvate decarboxylase
MTTQVTIGEYLLGRLQANGVKHVFGVPGDYVLRFYDQLVRSSIAHIGTTREDTAAFAADGYARCQGLGALAVTYGVGALNVVNAVAGAFAESSPVVVISGAPGVQEQRSDPMIHHRFGPFTFQREIFERITCAAVVLDDPLIAFRQIDRALQEARRRSSPVYIELPRDQVDAPGTPVPQEITARQESDPDALRESVEETLQLLTKAQHPAVLAGVQLHRRNLQDALLGFIEKAGLPVAATLSGKSVMGERHPAYVGVYEGAMGPEAAKQTIESADGLLMLGVNPNDVDLGIYTAQLNPNVIVRAIYDQVYIRHHRFQNVNLEDFLQALSDAYPAPRNSWVRPAAQTTFEFPQNNQAMTTQRLIQRIDIGLTPDMMVVCDVGDCLFASVDLRVHERTQFLASAYYTSMGFAVPAALGAQIAFSERRALVLVGDGAFQMTGTEVSTIARLGLNPIVIVFNNAGYGTERHILEGPFNDIAAWRFDRLSEVFGPLEGYDVQTEEQFEYAFTQALGLTDRPAILNVHLSPNDPSPAMQRLAEHLKNKVAG